MKCGLLNPYPNASKAPRGGLVGQKVLGQNPVEIQDRMAIEANLIGLTDKKLDGVFVIEDHLRFQPVSVLCLFAKLDEAASIEQGVCIAFEPTGIP